MSSNRYSLIGCGGKNHVEHVCEFCASNYSANHYKPKRDDSSRYRGNSAQRGRLQRKHPGKPKKAICKYMNLMKMNRGANSLYSLEWSLIDTIDIWTTALQVEYKDSHFLMDTCATFLYLQEKLISN